MSDIKKDLVKQIKEDLEKQIKEDLEKQIKEDLEKQIKEEKTKVSELFSSKLENDKLLLEHGGTYSSFPTWYGAYSPGLEGYPTTFDLYKSLEEFKAVTQLNFLEVRHRQAQLYNTIDQILLNRETLNEFSSISMYLDINDKSKGEEIYNALMNFVELLGFEIIAEKELEYGSIIGKFIGKLKRFFSDKDVNELLKDGEHALKLAMIDKVQSEVDINQATAAAKLLEASQNTKSCVFQIGSLVYLKHIDKNGEPVQIIKTLGREEMKMISKKPQLLTSPIEMMNLLENISDKKPRKQIEFED